MNSRDRAPLTLIVLLLFLAALAALLAPFVLANPAPTEPVPDTVEAPARPPVENAPGAPPDESARVRMAEGFPGAGAPEHAVAARMTER